MDDSGKSSVTMNSSFSCFLLISLFIDTALLSEKLKATIMKLTAENRTGDHVTAAAEVVIGSAGEWLTVSHFVCLWREFYILLFEYSNYAYIQENRSLSFFFFFFSIFY